MSECVQTLAILGDVTDAKDYHPAELVNDVVGAIRAWREVVPQVNILLGNHDFLRAGHPFFQFLGGLPGVQFITSPTDTDGDVLALWLPYEKEPLKRWAGMDFSHYQYVFLHQTAPGSVASNGQHMTGEALPSLSCTKAYSGDIHVPQQIGDIEYVGSPYHVHFGDKFQPRAVLLDRRGRAHDVHFDSILRRFVLRVTSLNHLRRALLQQTRPGDQVRVEYRIAPEDRHTWQQVRREVLLMLQTAEVEVHGIGMKVSAPAGRITAQGAGTNAAPRSPEQVLLQFVECEGLGAEALDVGLSLL